MRSPAAILRTFAHDWVNEGRHLRSLLDESRAIDKALAPLVEIGAIVLPSPLYNATVDDVIEAFRERQYRGRICIFHFGGHASGSMLLFDDGAGHPTRAHASGLAGYLSRQQGLVLVFLNGCCTAAQVQRLREAGVKAVVATTRAIQDTVAAEFAKAFYAELAVRPLRDAFDTAVQAVRLRWGDDPHAVTRDVAIRDESEVRVWPWIIDCDPNFETWTLGSEVDQGHGRRRRGGPLVIAAVTSVLATSLALSAETRRTTCRVIRLRPLCVVIGTDDVPALDKSIRYPLTVNPTRARPLPTEEDARRDAVTRGNRDAANTCAPLRLKADLVWALVEAHEWNCTELAHGFACGFDGEIVCRVRDRTDSQKPICGGSWCVTSPARLPP